MRAPALQWPRDAIEGLEVSVALNLEQTNRWGNLLQSLRRLCSEVEAGYGTRTVRFKETEVADAPVLVTLDSLFFVLKATFLNRVGRPPGARTVIVEMRELTPGLKRTIVMINNEVRAMVEAEFQTVFGGLTAAQIVPREKPKAFLSHNKEDKPFARQLAQDLEEQGVDVWFDEWEIRAGDSVIGKVQEGLSKCVVFLMVLTARFQSSSWCTEELRDALTRAIQTGHPRVIALLREDVEVPPLVRDRRWIDVRDDAFYPNAVEELLNSIYSVPRPSVE
jgi:hypothetical protein